MVFTSDIGSRRGSGQQLEMDIMKIRTGSWREWRVETVLLIASLFISFAYNAEFWTAVRVHAPGVGLHLALFTMITAVHFVLLSILCNRWTLKLVLPLILMISAAAAYFMQQYTVYLDVDMLNNVLQTDAKESRELLGLSMTSRIVLFGLLPSIAIGFVRLRKLPLGTAIAWRVAWAVLAVLVALGAALSVYQPLSSMMRNHKEIRYLVTPANYLVGVTRIITKDSRSRPREMLGEDATLAPTPIGSKPRLLVMVVGETVRAQNWGLNGYQRQTTPRLAQLDVISFQGTQACGTATEVSLPCMFTPWGRRQFDLDRMKHSQSVLHVLERAGVQTFWIDNQSGCKGMCEGLPFESIQHVNQTTAHCTSKKGCYDSALLDRLQTYLVSAPKGKDLVVVLHQLGNHGPSYYSRYPSQYKVYTPECRSDELSACTSQQITNSYDNAIVATDAFLADTIQYLSGVTDHDVALYYVSDHGESLGENGLYLHGLPYAIAPETQKTVPMFMWFTPGFLNSRQLNEQCVRAKSTAPSSHDNVFHTVLGLMNVRSKVYERPWDLVGTCELKP